MYTTTADKIRIMQAFDDGLLLEYKSKDVSSGDHIWNDMHKDWNGNPSWEWSVIDFRIKEEQTVKPQVFWMNVYGSVPGPGRYTSKRLAEAHCGRGGVVFKCTEEI